MDSSLKRGDRVRVTFDATVRHDSRHDPSPILQLLYVENERGVYSIPADMLVSVERITPAEPTDPAVRIADARGEVWASYGGDWYGLGFDRCRSWDQLVADFGPVEVIA